MSGDSARKRRNENAQLRKEEYEELASSTEGAGPFARASADVLARRRIVSVSDRSFGAPKPAASTAPLFGGSASGNNPFASVILKPAESGAIGESIFSGSTGGAGTIVGMGDVAKRDPSGTGTVGDDNAAFKEASEKLARCNKAFAKWLRRQQVRAPFVPWVDGVRDYINYVEPLMAQIRKAKDAPAPAANLGLSSQSPPANEDGMPLEPPAELIRADDGDETELIEVRASIRRLDRDNDKPTWRDLGKGLLRVMEQNETKAKRIVVRNDVGKVMLNFVIVNTMKFFRDAKGGLRVTAVVDDGPHNYLLRTKPPLEMRHLVPATLVEHQS